MRPEATLGSFRRSVQALAQPAGMQISLFPDFACVGDELALEFDEAHRAVLASDARLSAGQQETIADLDGTLEALSGEQNAAFWLERERLYADPRWETIRRRASAVLSAFGWPDEPPPRNDAVYVAAGRVVHNR